MRPSASPSDGKFNFGQGLGDLETGDVNAKVAKYTLMENTRCRDPQSQYLLNATSLHVAVHRNNIEAVEKLLKRGANINETCTLDHWGPDSYKLIRATPLHIAVFLGRSEIVELLKSKGADQRATVDYEHSWSHYTECAEDKGIHGNDREDNLSITQLAKRRLK